MYGYLPWNYSPQGAAEGIKLQSLLPQTLNSTNMRTSANQMFTVVTGTWLMGLVDIDLATMVLLTLKSHSNELNQ